jgi:hypothetical protein
MLQMYALASQVESANESQSTCQTLNPLQKHPGSLVVERFATEFVIGN